MDYGVSFRVEDGMIYTAAIDSFWLFRRNNIVHLIHGMESKYFTRIIFGAHNPESTLYPQRWHGLNEEITDINKSLNRQTYCRLLYAVAVEGPGWENHGVPIIESEIRTYW